MSESDDEKFLNIFELNNLEEVLAESTKFDLTVKELQMGLADLSSVVAFISGFLSDFYLAIEENRFDEAPRLTRESIFHLISLFESSDRFLEQIDVDCEDEENDEEG